jgi:hypothetical protein
MNYNNLIVDDVISNCRNSLLNNNFKIYTNDRL